MPPRRPPPEQQSLFPERASPTPDPGEADRPPRAPWYPGPLDDIPDVRDGLTRKERIILYVLHETQKEMKGRFVGTAMLYGRVVERINLSVEEFQRILQRMVGVQGGQTVPRPSPFSGVPSDADGGEEDR